MISRSRRTLLLQSLTALVRRILAAAGDLPLAEAVCRDLPPLRRHDLKIELVTPGMVGSRCSRGRGKSRGGSTTATTTRPPDRQNKRLLVTIA
jgi:hypothetical protein